MKKLKKYIWKRIIEDIENSDDEKIQNNVKAFKNKKELIDFVKFYSEFGFDDMKRVSSMAYLIRKKKYHYAQGRLLGDKTKAMPNKVYKKLIKYVGENIGIKQKLALEFEGIQGSRGEDTVRIKVEDIDFEKHTVRIKNRKRNRWYKIPLNQKLEKDLQSFILKNLSKIEEHNGFVFFSENFKQKRKHLSEKYLKTLVYNSLQELGLNKVYAKSHDGRNLYLYSQHSLRGHAGTRIAEKTNYNIKKVQELLNHEPNSASTTLLYLERDVEKDLKGII